MKSQVPYIIEIGWHRIILMDMKFLPVRTKYVKAEIFICTCVVLLLSRIQKRCTWMKREKLKVTCLYQKKWLQHVQRMGTNRLPKQALQYKPKGRRNIGRPRKRWRDQLHLEDQGTGNTPNPSGTSWWWWWWWLYSLRKFWSALILAFLQKLKTVTTKKTINRL